jgi:cytochrome c553
MRLTMKRTLILLSAFGLLLASLQSAATPRGDVEAGREKSAACAACHGADGNADNPEFPRLAGQHQDYMVRALLDYKSGARQNAIMAGIAGGLSERDMWDLSAYYASQRGDLYTPSLR